MPVYTATSLVVHRFDLGEQDRLLTLFTREYGKLSAIAKGARRAGSRLSGATELFTMSHLLLATGRTLDIITQCEIQKSFVGLRSDLHRLARATYFCELLDRMTGERDTNSSVDMFELTVGGLMLLDRAEGYLDAVVHAYELQLLSTLGYAPALDRCVVCGASMPVRGSGFSPSLGGLVCSRDRVRAADAGSISNDAITVLRQLQSGGAEAALTVHPSPGTAAEVAKALRWYVRFRSDATLKSADFLDQLRASV